jgi:chromosome segregation ATPase
VDQSKSHVVFMVGILMLILGLAAMLVAIGMFGRAETVVTATVKDAAERSAADAVRLSEVEDSLKTDLAATQERLAAAEARLEVERKAAEPIRAQLNELRLARERIEAESARNLAAARAQADKAQTDLKAAQADAAAARKALDEARAEAVETRVARDKALAEAKAAADRIASLEGDVKRLTALRTTLEGRLRQLESAPPVATTTTLPPARPAATTLPAAPAPAK